MRTELHTKLDNLFRARYGKLETTLNANVYLAAKTQSGKFEVPIIKVGSGGGTVISNNVDKNPPAMVRIALEEVAAFQMSYRLAIPISELIIATDKPEYFNYLMDAVVAKAIGNYKVTVGDENKVRFGTKYLTFSRPDGTIFETYDNGEYLTIELSGEWADVEGAKSE